MGGYFLRNVEQRFAFERAILGGASTESRQD
jgi:hypothetical protein